MNSKIVHVVGLTTEMSYARSTTFWHLLLSNTLSKIRRYLLLMHTPRRFWITQPIRATAQRKSLYDISVAFFFFATNSIKKENEKF